ncbi:S53 family peptidase [Actinoplanes sp. CA-030573]|uniref:S53 family peptidase n=1 Tax=Actinoplanes sp. CA-030573 TaxID=3239898 RepID=UPI003D90E09C
MRVLRALPRLVGVLLPAVLLAVPAASASAAPDVGASATADPPITVALTLTGARTEGEVQKYATAAVTPGTSDYRRYLTFAQVHSRFGAPASRVARVTSWARRAGLNVDGLDATGTRLTVTGSAANVQKAFAVTLHTRVRSGVRVRTAGALKIPAALTADVSAIGGLTPQVAKPMLALPGSGPNRAASCLSAITPAKVTSRAGAAVCAGRPAASAQDGKYCSPYWAAYNTTTVPQKYPAGQQSNQLCGYTGTQLRALYGLGATDTGAGQTIVIVGAYNRTSTLADADKTFAANGIATLPASRYAVKSYTGNTGASGCDESTWGMEQALDVQTVHTIAPAAKIVYAEAGDCTQLEETLAGVIADTALSPTIVSNSWGVLAEPSDTAYLSAVNSLLARAAILGIGTYVASGDYGDTTTATGASSPQVSFPASSPWATAVGGTTSALSSTNTVLWQTGWEDAGNTLSGGAWTRLSPAFIGGAGGGRSTHFDKPTWQSRISGSKRAVPDLSALADPYTGFTIGTTDGGQYAAGPVGGTSLATPIVAALAALAQAKAGSGSDIGLLSPLLYANATAGKTTTADVKHVAAGIWTPGLDAEHANGNYLVDVDATPESLTTGTGYDTVTGLGTPGKTFLTDVG